MSDRIAGLCKEAKRGAHHSPLLTPTADWLGLARSEVVCAKNIIVAPHHDDAALSLGGRLAANYLPHSLVVVAFGQCAYSLQGDSIDTVQQLTKLRFDEDRTALSQLGARLIALQLPEAVLRGHTTVGALYSGRTFREGAIVSLLHELFLNLARLSPHCVWHFPLSIGSHVDHAILASVGLAVSEDATNIAVEWYEDVPYVDEPRAAKSAAHIVAALLMEGACHNEADITHVYDLKHRALQVYRSQLKPNHLDMVRRCARSTLSPNRLVERYYA